MELKKPTARIADMATYLATTTRTRVLIYNLHDQETPTNGRLSPYGEATKAMTIKFIGTGGESPEYKLLQYYKGQI